MAGNSDYQARARNFAVHDLVHPVGASYADIGRVSQVWPGIGMVQVEFSAGSYRFPVEDLEKIDPGNSPTIPTTGENVPGGREMNAPVSTGRTPEESDGFIHTDGKDDTMGASDATVGPTSGPAASKTATESMADRVALAYLKKALYWHSADRNYRATRDEYKSQAYNCPKCKDGCLKRGVYKRRNGKSERLYQCPNCGFIIKRENIHDDHHRPPPEENLGPHGVVMTLTRGKGKSASGDQYTSILQDALNAIRAKPELATAAKIKSQTKSMQDIFQRLIKIEEKLIKGYEAEKGALESVSDYGTGSQKLEAARKAQEINAQIREKDDSIRDLKEKIKAFGKVQEELLRRLKSGEIGGKKKAANEPNKEQMQALRDYAKWAGSDWKKKLLGDWMRSGSSWPEKKRWNLLQQVRNNFGPNWLQKAKLAAEES